MLLIGSKALNYYIPKEYIDIDFIASKEEVDHFRKILKPMRVKETEYIISFFDIEKNDIFDRDNIEFLLIDNSKALTKYYNLIDNHNFYVKYATKEILYSIKKSHINFPIKFNKHIIDYKLLYDLYDKDIYEDITILNRKETEVRVGKLKTPKLNKSRTEFFDQSKGFVKSYFVHDDIHRMVAHQENPIYVKLQKKKDSVWCSKDLWNKLPQIEKIQCVLEEGYVIALERIILPFLFDNKKYYSYDKAIEWALMRICTTLCSGYFRDFAVNNYFEIKNNINPIFVQDFLTKVDNKEIMMLN